MKLGKLLIFLNYDQDSNHDLNSVLKTMTQTQTHKKVVLVSKTPTSKFFCCIIMVIIAY